MVVHNSEQSIFGGGGRVISCPVFGLDEELLIVDEVGLWNSRTKDEVGEIQNLGECYMSIVFAFLVSNLLKTTKLQD